MLPNTGVVRACEPSMRISSEDFENSSSETRSVEESIPSKAGIRALLSCLESASSACLPSQVREV